MAAKKAKQSSSTIALNKRARHDYHLTDKFEAGVALQGWEVKSAAAVADTFRSWRATSQM